jgi:hypothetical protein
LHLEDDRIKIYANRWSNLKYYSEDKMETIRVALEEKVLAWDSITTKKMFGCPCYKANNKLFGFLVTDGVVFTKLSETERDEVVDTFKAKPFQAGKRSMGSWPQVAIKEPEDIKTILPYFKKSYINALNDK